MRVYEMLYRRILLPRVYRLHITAKHPQVQALSPPIDEDGYGDQHDNDRKKETCSPKWHVRIIKREVKEIEHGLPKRNDHGWSQY